MRILFNICVFGLSLILGLSPGLWAQERTRSLAGRIININTKQAIPVGTEIIAKIPVQGTTRSYRRTMRRFRTQENGYFIIKIAKKYSKTAISIISIRGFKVVNQSNGTIGVTPLKKYRVRVIWTNGQPVNATVETKQERFQVRRGVGTLGIGTMSNNRFLYVTDQKSGKRFKVSVLRSNQAKNQAYWVKNANNEITIKLPTVSHRRIKYLVKNKEGKILKNFSLTVGGNPIKTNKEGHLQVAMLLDKNVVQAKNAKSVEINQRSIIIDLPVATIPLPASTEAGNTLSWKLKIAQIPGSSRTGKTEAKKLQLLMKKNQHNKQKYLKHQAQLGYLYLTGKGVIRDYAKGRKMIKQAAEHEHRKQTVPAARALFGDVYHLMERNSDTSFAQKALVWYGYAANQNDQYAMLQMAHVLLRHSNEKHKTEKAIQWLKKVYGNLAPESTRRYLGKIRASCDFSDNLFKK